MGKDKKENQPRKSGSSSSTEEEHEVFISFRGEDTRNTFTSHLNAALRRLHVSTYIDLNLQRGDEISATLLKAIEKAKLSVIVFSKNYATSKWCLSELMKTLECKRKNGQIVVPVFYHIDPSHVRNQTGSYADAFIVHEEHFKDNMSKVQSWRVALTEAANYSGWECLNNRMESEIVEEIAMDVLQKLDYVYVADLDHKIEKYEQLAQLQHKYRDFENESRTAERIQGLKYERDLCLLRLPPDM